MSEISVTRHDDGRAFEASRKDVIVLRLEENLTTGYGWEADAGDGSVVELIESEYIEASGKEIGRGGMRVLRFVAKSPGSQDIRLKLRRPWDSPDKALQQMVVKIQVR